MGSEGPYRVVDDRSCDPYARTFVVEGPKGGGMYLAATIKEGENKVAMLNAAYRAGSEAMRERAAQLYETKPSGASDVRALPLVEPEGGTGKGGA